MDGEVHTGMNPCDPSLLAPQDGGMELPSRPKQENLRAAGAGTLWFWVFALTHGREQTGKPARFLSVPSALVWA